MTESSCLSSASSYAKDSKYVSACTCCGLTVATRALPQLEALQRSASNSASDSVMPVTSSCICPACTLSHSAGHSHLSPLTGLGRCCHPEALISGSASPRTPPLSSSAQRRPSEVPYCHCLSARSLRAVPEELKVAATVRVIQITPSSALRPVPPTSTSKALLESITN